jgi:hypothetical protein
VPGIELGGRHYALSFPNFDPIFHNVFSLSKAKAFDLGMYKNDETREVKLDKPGIVRLGCNLHANMSAYLIVVDAPHCVIVEGDGSYSFQEPGAGQVPSAGVERAERRADDHEPDDQGRRQRGQPRPQGRR